MIHCHQNTTTGLKVAIAFLNHWLTPIDRYNNTKKTMPLPAQHSTAQHKEGSTVKGWGFSFSNQIKLPRNTQEKKKRKKRTPLSLSPLWLWQQQPAVMYVSGSFSGSIFSLLSPLCTHLPIWAFTKCSPLPWHFPPPPPQHVFSA